MVTSALSWPRLVLDFADWLHESKWAANSYTAYSTAMAVDWSLRDRNLAIRGALLPMQLFDVDIYESFYSDECAHAAWSHEQVVHAIGLFAMFVVAENRSPSQTNKIFDIADEMAPLGAISQFPDSPLSSTTFGLPVMTSHLQKIAEWSTEHATVPAACLAHPDGVAEIIDALGLRDLDNSRLSPGALALITYQAVIDTATSLRILTDSGHNFVCGPTGPAWFGAPGPVLMHRSVVEAYTACLTPILGAGKAFDERAFEVAASVVTTALLRSLVDDPMGDSEDLNIGGGTDPDFVRAAADLRFASMVDLGLLVPVRGTYCVPDALAPALMEALERDRGRRTRRAA